jgi:chemotaxis protein histidine kinase CheA
MEVMNMAGTSKSVVRVERITAAGAQKNERHNERKNESYGNENVDMGRIPYNVHYKSPGDMTYNEYFERLVADGKISTRGQKEGAVHFNEMVVDVNTRYFEDRGGYEYAKGFFEEAYRFCCQVYGEENIVSAVMHADEINKAVSDELGKPVYHYHLHVVAIPTVRKEIKWTKRCKNPELVGTVKEVIQQVSHSKKWKNTVPVLDKDGQQVVNKYGKPVFRKSYSVLQDELFEHMRDAGFKGFERGELGSTAEHLSSIEYQVVQEEARLEQKQSQLVQTEKSAAVAEKELAKTEAKLVSTRKLAVTYSEIEQMGKKGMMGKYTVTADEMSTLKTLAEEGVSSRAKVGKLQDALSNANRQCANLSSRLANVTERLQDITERYERLVEVTKPYIFALQHFPEKVKEFFEKLIPQKERAEEKEQPTPTRKPKRRDDWER